MLRTVAPRTALALAAELCNLAASCESIAMSTSSLGRASAVSSSEGPEPRGPASESSAIAVNDAEPAAMRSVVTRTALRGTRI